MPRINADTLNLEERVVKTNKVQKTHKGGRTLSWNALVVVGDGEGHVGVGLGKARGVPDAIRKGVEDAKKNIVKIPLLGPTIPHDMIGKSGSSIVMLKPAAPGTGVVAGGSVRAILEVAGVKDVLGKSLGSPNPINTAAATMDALNKMKIAEDVAKMRGKSLEELLPRGILRALAETSAVPKEEAAIEEVAAETVEITAEKTTVEEVKVEAQEVIETSEAEENA